MPCTEGEEHPENQQCSARYIGYGNKGADGDSVASDIDVVPSESPPDKQQRDECQGTNYNKHFRGHEVLRRTIRVTDRR